MARPKRDARTEHGQQFETVVAEIYAAMGFQVSRHVPMQGQEVDILAERRIPGADPYRVMVECKYKGGSTLAGNADVQAIAGAYQIARNTHEVSACTLVTTNGFSLAAQEAARAAGIRTVTRRELVQGLLDFSPYHRTLREEYVRDFGSPDQSWYIPARARQDEAIESLAGFVDEWRSRDSKKPLVILGGYGTGKTSFCRDYAIRLLDREETVFPVIISLRDFQKATKIESLIRDFLEEQCHAGAPRFDAFWRMYQEGLVLLMFDGFDEMASRVDSSVLEMNLAEIEKFARAPANMILTCRPEAFITRMEELRALEPASDVLAVRRTEYERVEMELWTPEQVSKFVQRRVAAIHPPAAQPPEFYLERIEQLPELHDMSSRAVHLDLIVRMLPSMIAQNITITRTNLYRTYLEHELRRETVQNRRLRVISDEDRVALIREIAARSFLEKRDSIDFDTAAALVKRVLNPPRSEIDIITRDLLNRSFLRRSGDVYEFAHKSFGEYLFAMYVHDELQHGRNDVLRSFEPSVAVAGMVLELFGGVQCFWTFAEAAGIDTSQKIRRSDVPSLMFGTYSLMDHFEMGLPKIGEADPKWASLIAELWHDARVLLNASTGYCIVIADGVNHTLKDSLLARLSLTWAHLRNLIDELQRLEINRLTGRTSFNLQRRTVNLCEFIHFADPGADVVVDCEAAAGEYSGDPSLLMGAFRAIAYVVRTHRPLDARVHVAVHQVMDGVVIKYSAETRSSIQDIRQSANWAGADRYVRYHDGRLAIQGETGLFSIHLFLPRHLSAS